jgi:energy-converting hydrogenase Eha subunit G
VCGSRLPLPTEALRLRENSLVTSYPTPEFRRPALAPGILGAIVLIAGLALLDNPGGYLFIKFGVAILALIMCVFAWQARQWWWIIGLAAIAVAWNPVWPFAFSGQVWVASQFVASLLFVATGLLVKVINPEDRNRSKTGARR